MKLVRSLLLASALALLPAAAESTDMLAPLGYGQATASASPANLPSLPSATQQGQLVALIIVETANIRWRDDGTDPSTTVGMLIPSGSVPFLYTGNIRALRFIAVSGSPVVNVTYYRLAGS